MTKDGNGYIRHMDELFELRRLEERDNSDQEYLERMYFQQRESQTKQPKPQDDVDSKQQ